MNTYIMRAIYEDIKIIPLYVKSYLKLINHYSLPPLGPSLLRRLDTKFSPQLDLRQLAFIFLTLKDRSNQWPTQANSLKMFY